MLSTAASHSKGSLRHCAVEVEIALARGASALAAISVGWHGGAMPWLGDEVANAREDLAIVEIAVAAARKTDETFRRLDEAIEALPERDRDRVVLVPMEDQHRHGYLADE